MVRILVLKVLYRCAGAICATKAPYSDVRNRQISGNSTTSSILRR